MYATTIECVSNLGINFNSEGYCLIVLYYFSLNGGSKKRQILVLLPIPKLSSFGKDSASRLLSLIVIVEILDVLVSKKKFSFLQLKQNNKDKINFSTWHPEGSKFTLKL